MIKDKRIKEYQYLRQLKEYMANAEKRYIQGEEKSFIYPKQLEIHLPSDRQQNCNLSCKHCFGTLYEKELERWEAEGIKLLHNLNGDIQYHIYGGSYTEPTMSPFLFSYLATTKMYGNNFGIHTNGVLLKELNDNNNFFKNLHEISTDNTDYISISLDAGNGISWKKLKRSNSDNFWNILNSLEKMANIREQSAGKESHAIRLVYLAGDITCNQEQFEFIVSFAKMLKLDSVRFSIPYDFYNKDFKDVKEYKEKNENRLEKVVEKYTKNLISQSEDEKPYIFWNPPYFTDIDRINFDKCYYGFFQITLGADGYIYPCSAVAAPTAKHIRKGEITSDLDRFKKQCWELQNNPINCKTDCFDHGLRGNRMSLEINEEFNK